MSWDAYVSNLVSSGHLSMGAICGLDGNVWAQSPTLGLTPAESQFISKGFGAGWSHAQQGGLTVGNTKYRFLLGDDCQVQCKQGACGIAVAKANTCMVVGVYKEGMQPGNARNEVEKIATYLQSQNY